MNPVHPVAVSVMSVREKENLHILVLLKDPVGVEHGSISHFFYVRTRLRSLKKNEDVGTKQLRGLAQQGATLPTRPRRAAPSAALTMATQPSAGMLSLTADKWLNSLLPRFFSLKFCTAWICSEIGFRSVENTFCTRGTIKNIGAALEQFHVFTGGPAGLLVIRRKTPTGPRCCHGSCPGLALP